MTKKEFVRKVEIRTYKKCMIGLLITIVIFGAIFSLFSKLGRPITLPAGASKTYIEYYVEEGDNLHTIASKLIKEYDMENIYSVDDLTGELSDLNKCFNNIRYGQTLICPVVYYEDSMVQYKEEA